MSVLIPCPRCSGTGDDPEGGVCSMCEGAREVNADHRKQSSMQHELLADMADKINDIKEKVDEIKIIVDAL